jgi:hypothetical protein
VRASVTFGETSWLLFGAVLGGAATYAMLYGLTLIARLMRACNSAAAASSIQPERASHVPEPRISD